MTVLVWFLRNLLRHKYNPELLVLNQRFTYSLLQAGHLRLQMDFICEENTGVHRFGSSHSCAYAVSLSADAIRASLWSQPDEYFDSRGKS